MNTRICIFMTVLLVAAVAGDAAIGADCCIVPDNGQGTVNIPPEGCQWRTSADTIIARSRDGKRILRSEFVVDSFFDVSYDVPGADGSQDVQFKANLTLNMIGSSGLEGFRRRIVRQVDVRLHLGPRNAGDTQSFETEILSMSLSGSILGDPDFDLLHVTAGSDFGMSSHGHVTLIKLTGGDFSVDSFFDITYQIDFQGAPGSMLEGMSGQTVGTVRIETCPPPPNQQKVVKFRQLPLNGVDLGGGVIFPYFGHDELSTAYSWYDFRGTSGLVMVGYKGCFVADDFADTKDTPVICIKWWGSYLGNEVPQPVRRFLIVFEEDVPADAANPFSHPGKVLSSQIVNFSPTTDPNALVGGEYLEELVGDGGAPCYERLYQYVAVLKQPFEQKPDTVYWLKIVALVDLDKQMSGELEGCLDNSGLPGEGLSLCEFLHLPDDQRQGICPNLEPLTRWGWHNRDYRVVNPEASTAVMPGENNQKNMFSAPFPTDVWHFQDDAVSGDVFTDPTKLLDPDLCPNCLFVQQGDFHPENYVYDKLCQQAPDIMGVDGPQGIERYSKDLAFVLITTEPIQDKDCNNNGIPDHIDIANGTSDDCNNNGIPDECENDCNCNGVDDKVDIANGTSDDCNLNGIPDECEDDCNGNGIPDDCDIANGTSDDCNKNGIPDECEEDCNGNGIPDDCDIAAGDSNDFNNNGIPDECEPPCPRPLVFRCVAGKQDNFDTSDGPEPTSPSLYLLNNPGYCYNGGLTQFDVLPINTCFIHTLNNCCWPANWKVISAKLEICLKGGTYLTHTDSMHFRQNGTNLWGISLNNLISWKTSGADTVWSKLQSECFVLDLSNLPLGGTDILSDLEAGFLDVVVADDTGVDYMILTVEVCPCEAQLDLTLTAGLPDNFAFPTEPTAPGTVLSGFLGCANGTKHFDSMAIDRCVGHTFTGLSPSLLGAQLEIRLKAGNTAATCNDGIALQATTLGPPDFGWSRRIGTAGSYSWCAGAPGLLATAWTSGSDHTFTLDLAALPNADGSTTCLIPQLILDGRLDVRVSDDTAVDYMILRTQTCCKKRVRKLGPADANNDLVVNFIDVAIHFLAWGDDARVVDVSDANDPIIPTDE